LRLPFSFPFAGRAQDIAYVSPNGALFFDATTACKLSVFNSCDLDAVSHGILAFFTDLDASNDVKAAVQYSFVSSNATAATTSVNAWAAQRRRVVVKFLNNNLHFGFNSTSGERLGDERSTFTATLFPTGGVALHYATIVQPSDLRKDQSPEEIALGEQAAALKNETYVGGPWREWLVSLRQPRGLDPFTDADAADWFYPPTQTPPQTATAARAHSRQGAYPPKASIVSHTTVRACVFGSVFCMLDDEGSVAGGGVVRFVSSDYSCLSDYGWTIVCRFGAQDVTASYNRADNLFSCVAPAAAAAGDVAVTLHYDDPTTGTAALTPIETENVLTYTYTAAATPAAAAATLAYVCTACQSLKVPSPTACARDCAGVVTGAAVVDQCEQCTNGTTGLMYNYALDCDGACFATVASTSSATSTYDAFECGAAAANRTAYCASDAGAGIGDDALCERQKYVSLVQSVESLGSYNVGLLVVTSLTLGWIAFAQFARPSQTMVITGA
jgi:hypothetical protein